MTPIIEAVSIHAPAGGATFFLLCAQMFFEFQSTRPRGARQDYDDFMYEEQMFQSTRPRGARLVPYIEDRSMTVSIHAPAGGATRSILHGGCYFGFNPRARGGRDYGVSCMEDVTSVSIHAPAGGATVKRGEGKSLKVFQSTRPRGARQLCQLYNFLRYLFQSTRPRGARQDR